ncbi:E3 ubiquitin-protein ligase PIB1 [Yarrowia sp. C11]|nr:E3 ubiquitin-protein ligase PIB1 [Yarrowia sp. E02]KAG5369624.1 E3 ubiquitin-protein ligase PIB1 [Yarrowia sp. C11]
MPVAVWIPDEQAVSCNCCQATFSLFNRRHHCRKCGNVVCNSCSTTRTRYPPNTYVVSPPSQIFLESPHVPHRTCDSCVEGLSEWLQSEARRERALMQRDQEETSSQEVPEEAETNHGTWINWFGVGGANEGPTQVGPSAVSEAHVTEPTVPRSPPSDNDFCPVCGRNIKKLSVEQRETHIEGCLNSAFVGSPTPPVRLIVYNLAMKDEVDYGECVICFEDFEGGDRVVRLDCLCLYHEHCIKGWFKKKQARDCPVHAVHE